MQVFHRSITGRFARAAVIGFAAFGTSARVAAAQSTARLPFTVGEELTYHASFARIPAGTARMRVAGIDTVRGVPAYHLLFTIDGGVIGFRVHDLYESWIDTATLSSLRFVQRISEGRYHRTTTYEIFPDRSTYSKNGGPEEPSVHDPLDDGSFIYAVRAIGVGVGDTVRYDRYFVPDRNPVVLTGLRRDTVSVRAGTYAAIVVRPTIRTKGIFSEGGDARIWISDDGARYPVQIRSHFAHFSLSLTLESVVPGTAPAERTALLSAARR